MPNLNGEAVPSPVSNSVHVNGFSKSNGISKHQSDDRPKPLPGLKASLLTRELSQTLRPIPQENSRELWSFAACSDHMITVKWTIDNGWTSPRLMPYGDLSISPAASTLHYATQCFEGMRAYRGHDLKLRLFRPELNCERMVASAARIALPTFDPKELEKLIVELIKVDGERWLPKEKPGSFIYIRPTLIGTGTQLGAQIPQEALLYIISVPWPDPTLWKKPGIPAKNGLKLLASTPEDTVRAWPGGAGNHKVGANYGPSFQIHTQMQALGYDQILWLFGNEGFVTEAGASNFFVVWKNKITGKNELVTATLEDHIILPGVVRRSVLEVARKRWSGKGETTGEIVGDLGLQGLDVLETRFTIGDIMEAWEEGRLLEAFLSGTAVSCFAFLLLRRSHLFSTFRFESHHPCTGSELHSWLNTNNGVPVFHNGHNEHQGPRYRYRTPWHS